MNVEELTKSWLWDTQVWQDGKWLSLYEAPFESYLDAEEIINSAVSVSTETKVFRIVPVIP